MVVAHPSRPSPFLQCGSVAESDSLAVLQLKRDLAIPTLLRSRDDLDEGYDEGKVTNTRFGSFPHSTLIGAPWGSQVRASAVDTGSRGRKGWEGKGKKSQKRKWDDEGEEGKDGQKKAKPIDEIETGGLHVNADAPSEEHLPFAEPKSAKEAATGFVHLLPPTPEIWTASLPHRTQVVYTPDYSYILHRIRARPGTRLIEAGAGSGSFTHAAARAVYNGGNPTDASPQSLRQLGKVYGFEFHEQRAQKLQTEIHEHGLQDVVELTHLDVCQDGFIANSVTDSDMSVNAVFLDLPAPWLALKHLPRSPPTPLDPTASVHLCTFSPCIEQVQRTITTMRQLGWVDIEMVEIAAKRIEVRRNRVGLQEEGLRGVNDSPADVVEALTRLREVEGTSKAFREEQRGGEARDAEKVSKQQRLENIRNAQEGRKLFKEGRLVHKAESELKTHTSYLVFAILPRAWTEEDEVRARERWPNRVEVGEQARGPVSKRARKKEAKARAGVNKAGETAIKGEKNMAGQV